MGCFDFVKSGWSEDFEHLVHLMNNKVIIIFRLIHIDLGWREWADHFQFYNVKNEKNKSNIYVYENLQNVFLF